MTCFCLSLNAHVFLFLSQQPPVDALGWLYCPRKSTKYYSPFLSLFPLDVPRISVMWRSSFDQDHGVGGKISYLFKISDSLTLREWNLAVKSNGNRGTQQEICFNTSFKSNCTISTIGVARGGAKGVMPLPKFLENIVILCFERRFSIQNSVLHLKSNILPPPNFWAGYVTDFNRNSQFRVCCKKWSNWAYGVGQKEIRLPLHPKISDSLRLRLSNPALTTNWFVCRQCQTNTSLAQIWHTSGLPGLDNSVLLIGMLCMSFRLVPSLIKNLLQIDLRRQRKMMLSCIQMMQLSLTKPAVSLRTCSKRWRNTRMSQLKKRNSDCLPRKHSDKLWFLSQ